MARDFLASWGLRARIPRGTLGGHFLHASPDDRRFELLKNALLNTESKAVWALRGGYGSNRLLPRLEKLRTPRHPKLVMGLSDISSLHAFLNQKWKWATVHGPVLERLSHGRAGARELREVQQLVFGEASNFTMSGLRPLNPAAMKVRSVRGPLVGGNLMTIVSAVGTPWSLDLRGRLLFLEEVAERGYRIDRLLEQMSQSGAWSGCKGVLLGEFLGGREPDGRDLVKPVLRQWALSMKIPVWSGVPCGHGRVQRPLVFGAPAQVVKKNKFELEMKTRQS